MSDKPLIYAHIGDLHIASDDQPNVQSLRGIVAELASPFGHSVDFAYIPGDVADNGRDEEYAIVARELTRLPLPVHVISGDHDVESGSLAAFYRGLSTETLPKKFVVEDCCCLCLDMSGPGSGGPDFRTGNEQLAWLRRELEGAAALSQRAVVFMHTYPADLKEKHEAEVVTGLLSASKVLLVDIGHTHYNEIANDGMTIFAATRSTGQIEEGPSGYSLISIDRRCVSWRFRELGTTSPQVLITAPADRRLATNKVDHDHLPRNGRCELRVSVLADAAIRRCSYRINDGQQIAMSGRSGDRYVTDCLLPDGPARISVEAQLEDGRVGCEHVDLAQPSDFDAPRHKDGSDADRIGAWPERGVLGTQLGPNRNGRQW